MPETGQQLLFPLDAFYTAGDPRLPRAEAILPGAIPEPYRGLLVHDHDMTPTLEAYHGGGIHVHALQVIAEESAYAREVVLERDADDLPVEYGAIRIHLEHFPPAAAQDVIAARKPLGGILAEHGIPHHSAPSGYYRFDQVDHIADILRCARKDLYGRTNKLLNPGGVSLAEVLEILPAGVKAT